MMRSPFSRWTAAEFRQLFTAAGFAETRMRIEVAALRYPSISEFLRREAASSPLAGAVRALSAQQRRDLIHDLRVVAGRPRGRRRNSLWDRSVCRRSGQRIAEPTQTQLGPSKPAMEAFLRDARLALRLVRREPGFALLAVVTLALGIGATTAIFTVVDSVLLRPLPYREPDRLVVALHGETASGPVSPADFLDYRRSAHSFERLAAAQAWGGPLAVAIGRNASPGCRSQRTCSTCSACRTARPNVRRRRRRAGARAHCRAEPRALAAALQQRPCSRRPSHRLDGQPYVVVGVMPPRFRFAPFW